MSLLASAWTLVAGAVFGLALAAPPGPMNAVIAEESVLRGWTAGFTAGLGAMTADVVFFVLSLVGVVAFVGEAPTVRSVMIAAGGLLMLYFAYGAVSDARETFVSDADPARPAADADGTQTTDAAREGAETLSDSRGFRKAFVLALTNPYQVVFWLTVGIGLLEPGTVDVLAVLPVVGADFAGTLVVQTGSPALLAGLFCGIVVWIVSFPATLVSVGERVDAFAPTVAVLSALVLAGFGVAFLWTAAGTLL